MNNSLITNYTEYKRPTLIEIFKLLSKTNCKRCGAPGCFAFAGKMSSDISALSAHVIVTDQMLSNLENLADKIRKMLKCDFNIAHPTLQFECRPYEQAGTFCKKNI